LSSYTRRAALAALLTGSTWWVIDSDAFESLEAGRSTDVSVAKDTAALLGIDGINPTQVPSAPHEIGLTNNLESSLRIIIKSRNDRFNFSRSGTDTDPTDPLTIESLPSGNTEQISVSTTQTGQVSDVIIIECESVQNAETIEVVRQLTIQSQAQTQFGRCLFVADKDLRTVAPTGSANDVQTTIIKQNIGNIRAIGASEVDFDGDDASDAVFLKGNGNNISLVDTNDTNRRKISTSQRARTSTTHLASGTFNQSDPSVFFINRSKGNNKSKIYALNKNGDVNLVGSSDNYENNPQSIAGIGDIDGDGQNELVYTVGGDTDNGEKVRYLDPKEDDSEIESNKIEVETDSDSHSYGGIGSGNSIGRPAEFNVGDNGGIDSVPIVDKQGKIFLIGPEATDQYPDLEESGVRKQLIQKNSNKEAAKSPVCPTDIDGDGNPEVVYIRNGGEEELQAVGTSGNFTTLKTSEGESIPANKNQGVTSLR
jgi:hypothetical protein